MTEEPTTRQRIAQGMLQWDQSDFEGARDTFEAVLKDFPGFPDVYNKLGLCRAMLGESEKALEAFDEAIRMAPTYAEAHVNRGIVLSELGRHEEAQEEFGESARLDTRDGDAFPSHLGNEIAVKHAELGDLYLAADRPESALVQYRTALEVRPRFMDIRTKLGEALLEMGALDEARRHFSGVLQHNPDYWIARLKLGVVLHRLGDLDGARREWTFCWEQEPEDMRPKAYLANLET